MISIKEEIWKKIENATKGHKVSSYGRVVNGKGRLLRPSTFAHKRNDWYAHLNININGKNKTCYVHRLVAEAFISNPEKKETINHKDGNKTNNFVENLEWATRSENTKHSWDFGLKENLREVLRQKRGKSVLAKKVICVESNKLYESALEASRQTGIAASSIGNVCRKKVIKNCICKTAGGFHWEYA